MLFLYTDDLIKHQKKGSVSLSTVLFYVFPQQSAVFSSVGLALIGV
jgi:hypothetical protein